MAVVAAWTAVAAAVAAGHQRELVVAAVAGSRQAEYGYAG